MTTSNKKKFEDKNIVQRMLVGSFQRRFINKMRQLQPQSVLEVGCGEGYLMNLLHQSFPGLSMRGLDINEDTLADGRAMFAGLDLRAGDIMHIAEPDASWDIVIASEVLEHLNDPRTALRELKRVAKRAVVLSVPDEPWFRWGNLARGRNIRRLGNHPEHVNLWSRRGFGKFVRQEFPVVKVTGSFPWTIVLAKK